VVTHMNSFVSVHITRLLLVSILGPILFLRCVGNSPNSSLCESENDVPEMFHDGSAEVGLGSGTSPRKTKLTYAVVVRRGA
jgi:hypothetical protein